MFNRKTMLAVIAIAVSAATPALARVEYAAYDGPDSLRTGEGGTRVTQDGIDFWTTGTPPRRYQVMGILTDGRSNRLWDGHAVGSSGLARRAHDLGANALIVVGENQQDRGIRGGWFNNGGGGTFYGHRRVQTTTQFLVVRYIDQPGGDAQAPAPRPGP